MLDISSLLLLNKLFKTNSYLLKFKIKMKSKNKYNNHKKKKIYNKFKIKIQLRTFYLVTIIKMDKLR